MNHHITIVCPGQGSQSVGMLSSFDDDFVNSEYEKIKDLFDIQQDRSIEIQNGVLIFKENGTSTFNLRPVSSLIRRREQPFYVSDRERFEENVEDGPELGGETDDDDSETIFYFPMMEISDSVVRLEQRIFGEQIMF